MNDDDLISQVHKKIEREKVLINAANAMRQSSNPQVQQSLDSQVREGRRNIAYLEERMRELQMRRTGQGTDSISTGPSVSGRPQPPAHTSLPAQARGQRNGQYQAPPGPASRDGRSAYGMGQGDYGDPGPAGYSGEMGAGTGMMPPRAPFGPPAPGSTIPKTRPNYSKLGPSIFLSHARKRTANGLGDRSDQIRYSLSRTQNPAHVVTVGIQIECRKAIQGRHRKNGTPISG